MQPREEDPASGSWHVDRRIPIALIITLAIAFTVQTFTFGVMAAQFSARLDQVERIQAASAPHSDRLTRLETRLEAVQEGIGRIERLIQQPRPKQ